MAVYNDGSLPYGSRLIQLTGSVTGAYVAESIEVTRPTTQIQRLDEIGEPNSAVYIRNWATGTATLQLATTASLIPANGCTFAVSFDLTPEIFVITQVGQPETSTTDKKITITFSEVINP
jgi:hypothetical protein